MRVRISLPILLAASTSFALPRPNSKVQSGANHHLGDRSYVAKYNHRPDKASSERDRMHQHLSFVHDWLAARPPTKPELASKRAEILQHFADYIAKDTTPKNTHVPWRTPVFIDDEGTICAVGYLIEQTAGRALPEKIAKAHRYDFIEDIAAVMPEVATWVEKSGLTIEEIERIQPAYSEPTANTWRTWNLAKYTPKDGAYDKWNSRGTFKHGKMEGTWVAYSPQYDDNYKPTGKEIIVGRGEMKHGAGTWTSFSEDGKKIGEGPYVDNRAQGAWKLYHPSGNLAAEGEFDRGDRTGEWHFYYDTPAKTPIAIGKFGGRGGAVIGRWKHFDAKGELLATTWQETPDQWHDSSWDVDGGAGEVLDIVAKKGEVKHVNHQGTVYSSPQSLDMYALGNERMYIHSAFGREMTYDANGFSLVHTTEGWTASDCHWGAKRKAYASIGDIVPLHGVLYNESHLRTHAKDSEPGGGEHDEDKGPACGKAVAVAAPRAKLLDKLLAAKDQVHAMTPQFIRAAVLKEEGIEDGDDAPITDDDQDYVRERKERAQRMKDMAGVLQANMGMYVEWPHIDGKFVELYKAMPGRITWNWTDGDPEAREAEADAEAAKPAPTTTASK